MSSKAQKKGSAAAAAAEQTVLAILLTQNAEVKEVKIKVDGTGALTMDGMKTALKKKEAPEFLGSYKYKSLGLFLFGYLKGRAGTENSHELPPPHDTVLAFGDMLLVASKDLKSWKQATPFKVAEYEQFYTKAFGGFDELDEEEAEEVEEEEEEVEAEEAEEADSKSVLSEASEEASSEEEDEEEEAEDEEAEAEAEEVQEVDDEVPIKKVIKKAGAKTKAKKPKKAAAADAAAAATAYLYVPPHEELAPEDFASKDYSSQDTTPERQRIVKVLGCLFSTLLSPTEVADLERCIYVATLRVASERHIGKIWSHKPFVEVYEMTARQIAANFHPSSYVGNSELFERYKNGYITFKEISEMDTYQLFEGRWHESFTLQQMREKRQLEGNKAMATDRFLCGRCHKRECTYYEMQTRSADEPMTIFITCLNCGKNWRQ
jgi:DNA-directed RNA polymerase subunit M/transcription elongation factor TFIIS